MAAQRLNAQYTCWMFTLHFPESGEAPSPPKDWVNYKYIVYQEEIAPNTGRHHYQGYVMWNRKRTLTALRDQCGPRVHWEPRRGTHDQARAYCVKDDTRAPGAEPVEVGTPPAPGKRSDIDGAVVVLREGGSMKELAENHPAVYVKFHRGLHAYQHMVAPPTVRTWHTEVVIYWGPSGTGKSRRAFYEAGDDSYVVMKPNCKTVWFTGYTGQASIIFDEFYGWCPRDLMQRICDRYPLLLQTGNGTTQQCLARTVYITSNDEPEQWWRRIGFGAPMRRRVRDHGRIEHMDTGVWTPPPPPIPAGADGGDRSSDAGSSHSVSPPASPGHSPGTPEAVALGPSVALPLAPPGDDAGSDPRQLFDAAPASPPHAGEPDLPRWAPGPIIPLSSLWSP